jgi:hypothetical protein
MNYVIEDSQMVGRRGDRYQVLIFSEKLTDGSKVYGIAVGTEHTFYDGQFNTKLRLDCDSEASAKRAFAQMVSAIKTCHYGAAVPA